MKRRKTITIYCEINVFILIGKLFKINWDIKVLISMRKIFIIN